MLNKMKNLMKNMKPKCKKIELLARVIIYKEGKQYYAVCLDFDVFAYGDTIEETEKEIKGAIIGYVRTAVKNNLDTNLLFRPADKKYWDMLNQHTEILRAREARKISKKIKSVFSMPLAEYSLCLN